MFIMKSIKLHTLLVAAGLLCLSVGPMRAMEKTEEKETIKKGLAYTEEFLKLHYKYCYNDWFEPFEPLLMAIKDAMSLWKENERMWDVNPGQNPSITEDYGLQWFNEGPLTISYKENHEKLLEEYTIVTTSTKKVLKEPKFTIKCTIQFTAHNKEYDFKKITLEESQMKKNGSQIKTTYKVISSPWGFIEATETKVPTIYFKKRVFKDKDGTHEVYEMLKDKKEYDKELLKRKIIYHFFTFIWNRNKPEKRGW